MIVRVKDHGGKSLPLQAMLRELGHTVVEHADQYDVFLTDSDEYAAGSNPANMIDHARSIGAKVACYPHGAFPHTPNEGGPGSAPRLVHGPRTVDLYMRHGYRAFDIGWYLCPQVPFSNASGITLFAGIHPDEHGNLSEDEEALNTEAYNDCLAAWGPPEVNTYRPDNGYDNIDRADNVVASGTYAMIALARSRRVIMFGQQPCEDPYPNWGRNAIARWKAGYVGEQCTIDNLKWALEWI